MAQSPPRVETTAQNTYILLNVTIQRHITTIESTQQQLQQHNKMATTTEYFFEPWAFKGVHRAPAHPMDNFFSQVGHLQGCDK